jgi:hypothetical protein
MMLAAVLLAFAHPASSGAMHPGDTIRIEVGSPELDGRVYKPHTARVRVWEGPGTGRVTTEWTNELTVGDSGGRQVHRWVTKGTRLTPAGDTLKWELRQTYDARTLAPYGIVRTTSAGARSVFQIDGLRVRGSRRTGHGAPEQPIDFTVERMGYVASATDLVPVAVGLKAGAVVVAPIWGPNQPTELRIFSVIGKADVNVEGSVVNAWKVEERKYTDHSLQATWYLLDKSPYMVYGEVPLPDGSVQRFTEIALPSARP